MHSRSAAKDVFYYRNTNELKVELWDQNFTMLPDNKTWYFINGTAVGSDIGTLNSTGLNISINAKLNYTVGFHQTVIRQCTPQNRLNELFINVNILQNTANIQLQTEFEVFVGKSFNYTFPNTTDNDPLMLVL